MFDIGWTEMLVVATVAIIVVGPKDLPRMLRSAGKTMGSLKRMANEFQGQFSDALREAETQAGLDDAKNSMADLSKINPMKDFTNSINPLSDIDKDFNTAPNAEAKSAESSKPTTEPAATDETPESSAAESASANDTVAEMNNASADTSPVAEDDDQKVAKG